MSPVRNRRRKEERPAQITEAAMLEFAEKGYGATRVSDVARRAGVSKGLMYLYFKTKDELFKAVVRGFLSPKVAELSRTIEQWDRPAEQFLRGPFLTLAKTLPRSPVRHVVRLMIAEGARHPDLTETYWREVIVPSKAALALLVRKGVERGEFAPTALERFPQLIAAPVLMSVIWSLVFERQEALDTDAFLDAHVDLLIRALAQPEAAS